MASSLQQRVITAVLLMIGLVAVSTLLPGFYFACFILFVVLIASWEWTGLIGLGSAAGKAFFLGLMAALVGLLFWWLGVSPSAVALQQSRAAAVLGVGLVFWLLCFGMLWGYPANAGRWNGEYKIALMGMLALLPTWVGFVQLKYMQPNGFFVLALIVMVAAVDVGAYFVGRALGHTKLAPELSPNKSWEGVWGGLLTCFLLGLALTWAVNRFLVPLGMAQMLGLLFLSVVVTFFAVTGDLLESMLKRNRHIKDSGALLPGHGGLLDRVDALMAVTPVFVLTLLLTLTDNA